MIANTTQRPLLFSQPTQPAAIPSLRDYQISAVESAIAELADHRATLVMLATGCGKTQVACELIRRTRGRSLFIAHRDELLAQASTRIEQFTGVTPEREQAGSYAFRSGVAPVVASIQSLSRPHRLEAFDRNAFELVIVDEVHHATASTYRRVIDHFAGAKIVGLTATPDRSDGSALGKILESVACQYDLAAAIADGWLCQVITRRVVVAGLDFSRIKTVAGDLSASELATVMEQEGALHEIAAPTVELSEGRKTIVFASSVAHAERLAEIINRYSGRDVAMSINGETDRDMRRLRLREFADGRWQYLCNCGIATEGFDSPGTSCVVMGRPTKSRSLYAQMLGRGTRGGARCPVGDKTDLLVLDFVGNSGRHSLVSAVDLLAGSADDDEIARAKAWAEQSERPVEVGEAIAQARAARAAEIAKITAEARRGVVGVASYRVEATDPFSTLGVKRDYLTQRYGMSPASDAQIAAVARALGKILPPPDLSKHEASHLLQAFADRRQRGLATYSQVACLAKKGCDARTWTFAQASATIDWMSKNSWRRPGAGTVAAILGRE